MQILYEMDLSGEMNEEKMCALTEEKLSGNHIARGQQLLKNTLTHLAEVDEAINQSSSRWKTSRMPKVDLAIMRLAVSEIFYSEDVPEAVAINEAIELGRKFSTPQSPRFIHGVLGAISKNHG